MTELNSWERKRQDEGWPTPNHMRRAAEALDALSPAKYGDVLRHVANLCDSNENRENSVNIQYELESTLFDITKQIERVYRDAIEKSIDPTQMVDPHGNYVLAPLLVAKANLLGSLDDRIGK